MFFIVDAQALAHPFLTDDIQSDRRFIEKQDTRLMNERSDQFHFHSLAQRKFAHHHVHFVSHLQKFRSSIHDFFESIAVDSVNRTIKFERFLRRQVPPQRILLSHEQTKLALHFVAPFPRNKAEHARVTRSWVQQTRKHFEHSGLPGTVWTEKPDKFAFLDLKRDLVCCSRLIVSPPRESFDRAPQPTLFAVSAIDFC